MRAVDLWRPAPPLSTAGTALFTAQAASSSPISRSKSRCLEVRSLKQGDISPGFSSVERNRDVRGSDGMNPTTPRRRADSSVAAAWVGVEERRRLCGIVTSPADVWVGALQVYAPDVSFV